VRPTPGRESVLRRVRAVPGHGEAPLRPIPGATAGAGRSASNSTLDRIPTPTVARVTTTVARGLRVAEFASAVGLSPDRIRSCERAGLLPPSERSAAGYRSDDAGAVDRLQFTQGAQRLGLRLADVRDLLAVRDTSTSPCEAAEQLLRRQLAEVDAELSRLLALQA
jgi:DNA-binding transcriptional MerR regulator